MNARSCGKKPDFLRLVFQFFRSSRRWQMFQSPPMTMSGYSPAHCSSSGSNSSRKRYFSSCFGVSAEPDGRYNEPTRVPSESVAAMKRPASSKLGMPKVTSLSGVRDRMPTPARPFAPGVSAGATARCHPVSSAGDNAARAWSTVARTSCISTTSAGVSASQASRPRLFSLRILVAARMPLTLTDAIVRLMCDDPSSLVG